MELIMRMCNYSGRHRGTERQRHKVAKAQRHKESLNSTNEYIHFLRIAMGSLYELP